jgi:hypothetical protein
MGFMDKAKKLAEQAQEKLDEAQKNINQGQGSQQQQQQQQASGGVRYDQHGRPIEDPPAGAAPPPSAEPVDTGAEETPQQKPDTGSSNATPDPFKPIQ